MKVKSVSFQKNPGENQVLVEVKSCGMNFADIYTRQGLVRNEPGPPFIMGLECSGLIVMVGSNIQNFQVNVTRFPFHK